LYEENIRYSSENLKHYQKSFKEALKINDFNQTYGKLNELKKKSLSSKTALEEQYNFNIDESKDVNILEVNGAFYYNILISRNEYNPEFFENLLFKVENSNNTQEISAYIIKYDNNHGNYSQNISNVIEFEQLLGKVTIVKTTVCVVVCTATTIDHPYAHSPYSAACNNHLTTMCLDFYTSTDDGGGSGPGGNGTTGIDLGNGSGGGGTNGGGSPDTNPTNPPNQNGQTNNIPPLELILDPVLEEEPIIIDPCSELNKILKPRKNPFVNPGSKTITDALIHLDSDPVYNATNETGYNLIYDSNNEYAAIQVPFENTGVDYVKYSKNERVIGGAHAHQSIAAPMPSVLDLIPLLRFYENFDFGLMNISDPSQNYMIPFHIMTCKDGGIYALKIENLTKFQAMGTSIFSNALKSADFNARLANIYQKIYNPTQRKYEEAFVKYISNYNNKSFDTGVGTYFLKPTEIQINGVTKSIKQWNKLSLNSQGHIVEIPCN
jgi:hypothetical protein